MRERLEENTRGRLRLETAVNTMTSESENSPQLLQVSQGTFIKQCRLPLASLGTYYIGVAPRGLSFFGQTLNNTSEQSEVSPSSSALSSIDFSPYGRRPLVRYAHRKLRLGESKESLLALPSGSSFVKQNLFNFYIKEWSG